MKNLGRLIAVVVVLGIILGGAEFFWKWFFCRFYVPPRCMAVVTAKTGKAPAPGSLLVERGEKGIWREVLPEGRHYLNPVLYDVTIVPAVSIPLGKVGIVTSKVGRPLPPGEIIAPDRDSQGIWRNVLGPGLYRLNPQGYTVEIADATNIPVGYVGVVTSQTGPVAPAGNFAGPGQKGVLKDILQPGLYYLNPRAYQVNIIEIGMNQVSMIGKAGSVIEVKNQVMSTNTALAEMTSNILTKQQAGRMEYAQNRAAVAGKPAAPGKSAANGKPVAPPPFMADKAMPQEAAKSVVMEGKAKYKSPVGRDMKTMKQNPAEPEPVYSIDSVVEFPSRDGFVIRMDMTVEFELLPENVSLIYMLYGDLPKVVEKIILPQILSVSRLKGSNYKAQDFIVGDGREIFQSDLRKELVTVMKEKKIIIHNAIIRNVVIPENILMPIRASSIAIEQNLTNKSLQETAKISAELNAQEALIEQKHLEVEQQTKKKVAEIAAEQLQQVRMIQVNTELEVAKVELERADVEAKTAKLRGETEANAAFLLDNERALGTKMRAEVLGQLGIMANLQLVENLNPNLKIRILHAGNGTLWTDLKAGALNLDATPAKSE